MTTLSGGPKKLYGMLNVLPPVVTVKRIPLHIVARKCHTGLENSVLFSWLDELVYQVTDSFGTILAFPKFPVRGLFHGR